MNEKDSQRLSSLLARDLLVHSDRRKEIHEAAQVQAKYAQTTILPLDELEDFVGAAQLLLAARDLIGLKGKWTYGHFARDKNSHGVSPWSSSACKHCAAGACYAQVPEEGHVHNRILAKALAALNVSARTLYGDTVVGVNDAKDPTAWKNVQTMFTGAIASLESELLMEAYRHAAIEAAA